MRESSWWVSMKMTGRTTVNPHRNLYDGKYLVRMEVSTGRLEIILVDIANGHASCRWCCSRGLNTVILDRKVISGFEDNFAGTD
jgi:hypothetical protein